MSTIYRKDKNNRKIITSAFAWQLRKAGVLIRENPGRWVYKRIEGLGTREVYVCQRWG
jgi:hypothetical protein